MSRWLEHVFSRYIHKTAHLSPDIAEPIGQIILMADPSDFNVSYKINTWMKPNTENRIQANKQWRRLHNTLVALGVEVKIAKPRSLNIPDFVFSANAGIIHDNFFVPSRFKHLERQKEEGSWIHWFKNNTRCKVLELFKDDEYFEGAGDCLKISDTTFIAGCGFRSNLETHARLETELNVKVVSVNLVDSRFYHLDTCFCPLHDNSAIFFPGAFDRESIKLLSNYVNLIEVCEQEANKFACNAIVVDNNVIVPAGCNRLTEDLIARGYEVYPVEMSEFIKSGGACKCLTLKL